MPQMAENGRQDRYRASQRHRFFRHNRPRLVGGWCCKPVDVRCPYNTGSSNDLPKALQQAKQTDTRERSRQILHRYQVVFWNLAIRLGHWPPEEGG